MKTIMKDDEFFKLFSILESKKPDFGKITLELIYHQKRLTKVRILQKEDVIVLEKPIAGQEPKGE